MWRTNIRQSSMPTPSRRCRRNLQGELRNARLSRSARQPSRANTAESTRSPNCLSVGNAEHSTDDALGRQAVKRELCSAVSTAKKYCHHLPTMEEVILQEALMNAILKTAKSNPDILQTLKMHIQMELGAEVGETKAWISKSALHKSIRNSMTS